MATEIINIEGWKGKDNVSITEERDSYLIIEHRKQKEDGKAKESQHEIPKENVRQLWKLIDKYCIPRIDYKYKYLVRMLLEHYNFHNNESQTIEQFMESFNGGKNRAKYYFLYFYYPLKVLEKKGYLFYFGRGGIQKLKTGELK